MDGVQNPEIRPAQEHVVCSVTMPRVIAKHQIPGASVVRALNELLEDRKPALASIAQVDRDLVDVVGAEPSHFFPTL